VRAPALRQECSETRVSLSIPRQAAKQQDERVQLPSCPDWLACVRPVASSESEEKFESYSNAHRVNLCFFGPMTAFCKARSLDFVLRSGSVVQCGQPANCSRGSCNTKD